MVLESREFDLLLGRILSDGTRAPGLIDKFGGGVGDDLPQKIVEIVAEDSERKGLFEDSIHLYDLASKHEKVGYSKSQYFFQEQVEIFSR